MSLHNSSRISLLIKRGYNFAEVDMTSENNHRKAKILHEVNFDFYNNFLQLHLIFSKLGDMFSQNLS